MKGVRKEEELGTVEEEEGPMVAVEDEVDLMEVEAVHTAAEAAEGEAMTEVDLDMETVNETIETVDLYRSRKDRKSTSLSTRWVAAETE